MKNVLCKVTWNDIRPKERSPKRWSNEGTGSPLHQVVVKGDGKREHWLHGSKLNDAWKEGNQGAWNFHFTPQYYITDNL